MAQGTQPRRVVVVGAGLMGTGIAHAFATTGHRTVLMDVRPEAAAKAAENIHGLVQDGIKLGKLDSGKADAVRELLSTTSDLEEAARDAELLVETASEDLAIKADIVRRVDPILPRDAILATNTSALSITEIAAFTADPGRVIGMHFFNPVHKMKLVEIVRGIETSAATIAGMQAWCEAIGKISILVNETPGLTTSRMSAMAGNEAMWMLLEGTATAEDIDTAMRLGFNHPMGPLELGDLTGWDTRLAVLNYLHKTLGEKFRPCPLITKMVKAGRLGRKVGRGVYEYRDGKKVPGSGLRNVI